MAGNEAHRAAWAQRLVAELKRDKKKTALMVVLGAVAVIVGARLVLKGPPAKARAAASAAPPPAAPLSPAPGAGEGSPERTDVSWQAPQPQARTSRAISRDLFSPQLELFPPAEELANVVKVVPPTSAPAVDSNLVEAQAIRAQAQALVLHSTIISAHPTAIINGQVLGMGDWISGFQVVEITARACVLEKKGTRIQLEMVE